MLESLLRTTWTTVRGWRMHARVAVQPPGRDTAAMVLVHGVGVSGRYLLPTAERLARRYPTYVPDLPGFGRSDKPARRSKLGPGKSNTRQRNVASTSPAPNDRSRPSLHD